MSRFSWFKQGILFLSLLLSGCVSSFHNSENEAKILIKESSKVFDRFDNHKTLKEYRKYLNSAYAVIIFPKVIKASFMYGGEGGNGLLLKRFNAKGWSHPTFVTLAAASIGFQVGVQETAVILIIKTEPAWNLQLLQILKLIF